MSEGTRRIRTVRFTLGLLLVVFVVRLWELQLTKWVAYAQKAAGNRTQVTWTEGPRGPIFDRNGVVLAENRSVWKVGVDPAAFPKNEWEANRCILRLAGILNADVPAVRQAVAKAIAASAGQCMAIEGLTQAENVPFDKVAQIEENAFDLPGIVVLQTLQRYYPRGRLAAHLLGYARPITAQQYEELQNISVPEFASEENLSLPLRDPVYSRNSTTGQAGVELLCELHRTTDPPIPILTGLPGRTVREVNVLLQPVRVLSSREPVPGAAVYLTIDVRVQEAAEKALDETLKAHGRAGSVVVLDVRTGEVVAACSRPAFDPNKWVVGFKPQEWHALTSDPRTPLVNTAVAGAYPPGSTFKMISALAALESAGLATTSNFYCGGRISVGHPATIYRCWRHSGHGYTDFWRGLAESCDVYFYELVRKARLSPEAISYWAHQFGLGHTTGCGLPEENSGLVPSPDWKLTLLHERWHLGDTLNMVIGQGYLTATPLQMAVATAAIANGGKVYRPLLVRKIYWPAWVRRPPWVCKPMLVNTVGADPKNLAKIRRAMRLAVVSPKGTAHGLASLAVPTAGKTGSAEHRPNRPTHAWFACFAPYDNPQYAVVVFVDSGGHGGQVALPIAKKVLAALLRVQDRPSATPPAESD
jgi:penicillin-binding protein 2